MEHPLVTVTDISGAVCKDELKTILSNSNLGDATIENRVNQLLHAHHRQAKKIFHLKWEGGKIPRGAVICDQEISWTQNGIVQAMDGDIIGTYHRLVEFGGNFGSEQQMIVFV